MNHPQPTTALLLLSHNAPHSPRGGRPGLLLVLLTQLRRLRARAATPVTHTPADAPAAASVSLPAHGDGASARVRSGLGGRMERARRRRGARVLRRRGDLHIPGRRTGHSGR